METKHTQEAPDPERGLYSDLIQKKDFIAVRVERDSLRAALDDLVISLQSAEIMQFPNRKANDDYEKSFIKARQVLKATGNV